MTDVCGEIMNKNVSKIDDDEVKRGETCRTEHLRGKVFCQICDDRIVGNAMKGFDGWYHPSCYENNTLMAEANEELWLLKNGVRQPIEKLYKQDVLTIEDVNDIVDNAVMNEGNWRPYLKDTYEDKLRERRKELIEVDR